MHHFRRKAHSCYSMFLSNQMYFTEKVRRGTICQALGKKYNFYFWGATCTFHITLTKSAILSMLLHVQYITVYGDFSEALLWFSTAFWGVKSPRAEPPCIFPLPRVIYKAPYSLFFFFSLPVCFCISFKILRATLQVRKFPVIQLQQPPYSMNTASTKF